MNFFHAFIAGVVLASSVSVIGCGGYSGVAVSAGKVVLLKNTPFGRDAFVCTVSEAGLSN